MIDHPIPVLPTRQPTRIHLLSRQSQDWRGTTTTLNISHTPHISHQQVTRYAFSTQTTNNNTPFTGATSNPASGQLYQIGTLLKGRKGMTWNHSTANEIGRLAQGVVTCMPTSNIIILFIPHSTKSKKKKEHTVSCCDRLDAKSGKETG